MAVRTWLSSTYCNLFHFHSYGAVDPVNTASKLLGNYEVTFRYFILISYLI